MPELRRDPIIDRWVIIAENRGKRPGAFAAGTSIELPLATTAPSAHADEEEVCPFCPGNERETPPATFESRDDAGQPDAAGWRVRIVPNKYPALIDQEVAESLRDPDFSPPPQSLFASAPAAGVHEVIIDTPRHVTTVGELTDAELSESLLAIRARLQSLRRRTDLAHALVFRNVGRAAGATRSHIHSQLMATQSVASLIRAELEGAKQFFDEHRQCVFCRMIAEECTLAQRVVGDSAEFIGLCPYASRFPYETWILPKRHASHFEQIAVEDLDDLVRLARGTIARIERLSQPAAYNLIFHTSPFDSLATEHYHWHIEIIPRLTIPAGFEWGSGWAVNPVSPETAAGVLRTMEG
ncbi:MAG TPA: galactose-1-phosphate uridylyltransferase [Pirellulales bacterium]|nr:galactose-1-phosphate uridylyltransferase [Pirellulales bacterium]